MIILIECGVDSFQPIQNLWAASKNLWSNNASGEKCSDKFYGNKVLPAHTRFLRWLFQSNLICTMPSRQNCWNGRCGKMWCNQAALRLPFVFAVVYFEFAMFESLTEMDTKQAMTWHYKKEAVPELSACWKSIRPVFKDINNVRLLIQSFWKSCPMFGGLVSWTCFHLRGVQQLSLRLFVAVATFFFRRQALLFWWKFQFF